MTFHHNLTPKCQKINEFNSSWAPKSQQMFFLLQADVNYTTRAECSYRRRPIFHHSLTPKCQKINEIHSNWAAKSHLMFSLCKPTVTTLPMLSVVIVGVQFFVTIWRQSIKRSMKFIRIGPQNRSKWFSFSKPTITTLPVRCRCTHHLLHQRWFCSIEKQWHSGCLGWPAL